MPHFPIAFIITSLMLNAIPGPDILYILSKTFNDGRPFGVAATLGISTGLLIHAMLAATGLSLIILHSTIAFSIVKYFGAAYIIYLGLQMFFQKSNIESASNIGNKASKESSYLKIFKKGLFVNLFNPKVAIFFIAFIPQFVDVQAHHLSLQFLYLGIIFIITGTVVNLSVAFAAGYLKLNVISGKRFQIIQKKVTGSILVFIGSGLIALHKQ